MRLLVFATLLVLSAACSSAPRPTSPAKPTLAPATSTAAPTATARPTSAPTSTPQPDYRSMRTRLLTPLGALIVVVRGTDRTNAPRHLADFNKAADEILPRIERDMSKQANTLHSAIVNVRAHPGDLDVLEGERRHLISDIP